MRRSMDCADDCGFRAATRAAELRVTSKRAVQPFTTRGEGGERKWLSERSGRRVLRISDGCGKARYWRAPKPRPRPNRRARRVRRQEIVQASSKSRSATAQFPPDAAEVIMVLQQSLQRAVKRAEDAEQKLQELVQRSAKYAESVAVQSSAARCQVAAAIQAPKSNVNLMAKKASRKLRGRLSITQHNLKHARRRLDCTVDWWRETAHNLHRNAGQVMTSFYGHIYDTL